MDHLVVLVLVRCGWDKNKIRRQFPVQTNQCFQYRLSLLTEGPDFKVEKTEMGSGDPQCCSGEGAFLFQGIRGKALRQGFPAERKSGIIECSAHLPELRYAGAAAQFPVVCMRGQYQYFFKSLQKLISRSGI